MDRGHGRTIPRAPAPGPGSGGGKLPDGHDAALGLIEGDVLEAARERGLLIGKGGLQGHALRMAPPMNITEADAKEGMGLLIDALRAVDAEAAK